MPELDEITAAWERAAQQDGPLPTHPSSRQGERAYLETGRAGAELFAQGFPSDPEALVIDFGCGDGRVAHWLCQLYGGVLGVDASPTMLEKLDTLAPCAELLCSNGVDGQLIAGARRLNANRADALHSTLVFIHQGWGDGADLLAALARAVKPGGLLGVQIPSYTDGEVERLAWSGVTTWRPERIETAADAADLEIVSLAVSDGSWSQGQQPGDQHRALQWFRRPS